MNQHIDLSDLTIAPPAERMFRVDWAVELPATSAREAAGFASEIQYQDNTATIFSVTDKQTGEITIHDVPGDVPGTNIAARRPVDTDFVPRTLRPGGAFKTREGHPVEIVSWEEPGEFPLAIRIDFGDGSVATGVRTKAGLHPAAGGKPHPLDVVEANPSITKWVRVYDRKLNAAGKQVVSGKEFAAERALNWYIFDTEEEARASLQGVRAVFPITYREGEGLG